MKPTPNRLATSPAKAGFSATPTFDPFWAGTRHGELRLQHCQACGSHMLYPRLRCPDCGSVDLDWKRASGKARLHSYVSPPVPASERAGDPPYVIAVVELDEGVRMMSKLVGLPPDSTALPADMRLEVVFEPRGDEMLPAFKRAGS